MAESGKGPADTKEGAGKVPAGKEGQTSSGETDLAAMEERLSKAIGGMVRKQVEGQLTGAFKSEDFQKTMQGYIAEAIKAATKPPPPPPTEVEAVHKKVAILEERLQNEAAARNKAEARAREQQLSAGVRSVIDQLDGRDGRPAIRQDARDAIFKLIAMGDRLSGPPDLDDAGNVVVSTPDGMSKPLLDVLSNGYFGENHWATERQGRSGSGAAGGVRAAMGAANEGTVAGAWGDRDHAKAFNEFARSNPGAAKKLVDEYISRTRDKMARRR